tara:strand:- start:443 stop:739 length:297 start_codon:yes stop_codon:yes gene_type:complete
MPNNNIEEESALAQFFSNIYTEVFANNPINPNAPINTTQHLRKEFLMDDKNINVVETPQLGNNNFWVWGIAGYSDTLVSTGISTMPLSARYEGTANWG